MNIRKIVNEEIHRFLKEETEENGSVSSLVPDEMKSWNPIKDFKDGYSNGSDAVDGKMNNNGGNNSNQSPANMAGNSLDGSSEGAAGGMEGMAGGAERLAGGIEGAEMAAVVV